MTVPTPNRLYLGSQLVYQGALLTDQAPSSIISTWAAVAAVGDAVPFTPGPWVELNAALPVDCSGLYLYLAAAVGVSGGNTATLLEFATGAAGAEVSWCMVNVGYQGAGHHLPIPGFLPAGARVSVRVRSVTVSKATSIIYGFIPATKTLTPGAPVALGVNTAAARGTTLTAAAVGVKGAWVTLSASTPADFNLVAVLPGGNGANAMQPATIQVDIGVGAAGAETVIIPDVTLVGTSGEVYNRYGPTTYGVNIPAGSRVAGRYLRASASNQCDLALVCA